MEQKVPKQFTLTNVNYSIPDKLTKEIKPENLSNLNIYVTEKDYFLVKFENIFTDYIIDFTNKKDVFNWTHSRESYMKFWQCQLNFVIWCSTTGCGISRYHLLDDKLPNLIKSVIRFHVYFTARTLLSKMSIPLPGDDAFNPKNNPINMSKFDEICREYNVKSTDDFRFLLGPSHGMGVMYANLGSRKNMPVRVQYGDEDLYFRDHDYTSKYFGSGVNVNHLTNPLAKNGWNHFILNNSQGLTKPGIQSLNDSIRNYVILILGSQVESRSQIVGNSGKKFDAQKLFLTLFESSINQSKSIMISEDISRFQDYVTKARIHLNYVIGPDLYLISDNLVMNLNSHGYNNQLIVGKKNQHFGVNKINEMLIPRVPLMQGSKPISRPLLTKHSLGDFVTVKQKNTKHSLGDEVTVKQKNTSTSDETHENTKLALYFLSSLVLGLVLYFK